MYIRRSITIVLVASAVMLAVGVGPRVIGSAQALPPAQESQPVGATVPYPGRLADEAGQAVADGAYDFAFALYNAESGGEPLWSEVQKDVAVQEGAFNTLLGSVNAIPVETLSSGERWLEVGVRGPGEAEFTALTPRQRLSEASALAPASTSASSSGMTCPHDHWGETWEGSTGWLYLHNTSTGNTAYLPGWLAGVYGFSDTWAGVHGQSTKNIGVYGQSTDHYGVQGSSANSYGGFFSSDKDDFDLALGGSRGRINSDPDDQHSSLYISSNADVTIKLDNDGGEDHLLRVLNSGGTNVCTVSENTAVGLVCTNKSAVVGTANYGSRLLYVVESPEVWFEDFGAATLVDGRATVAFEPIFAETVNTDVDYHVFVTPLCQEPVLLFVTNKGVSGFTVRGVTLDGEPSDCAFDYRIAAKRLGFEDVRLEETAWQEGE